jgi:hypothetical protein
MFLQPEPPTGPVCPAGQKSVNRPVMRRFFSFILFFLLYLSSSIYFYGQANAKMYAWP